MTGDSLWADNCATFCLTFNGMEFTTTDLNNDDSGHLTVEGGGITPVPTPTSTVSGMTSACGIQWFSTMNTIDSVMWTEMKIRVTAGVDLSLLDTGRLNTSGQLCWLLSYKLKFPQ